MRSKLRIVVVGDAGVGKSTLITSFLREAYESKVPRVLPEISIPAEVTIDKVQTYIVDTSATAGDDHAALLTAELQKADVVCLVYAAATVAAGTSAAAVGTVEAGASGRDGLARVSSFWIPHIRSTRKSASVPVILVGNKIDLRAADQAAGDTTLDDAIIPLMNDFKEIETCIECSAKDLVNVAEVFYFASKAVLHPTTPLYDLGEQTLRPAAAAALTRIFTLSDVNKNGVLEDVELNDFQRKVFGVPLQQQELEGVKDVVREGLPRGLTNNLLNKEGFIYLHTLFIQRGRLETIWAVLRKFGYDDALTLREDFLRPDMDVSPGATTELSPKGYQFLTDLFQIFDKDKDGALKPHELDNLFATSPGNLWLDSGFPDCTTTNDQQAVTLQGFLALWSMTTLLDYRTTLAYLAYLGYPNDTTSAIRTFRNRKPDRMKGKTGRNVFRALVFGAAGSGKTEILKRFVEKPFGGVYKPTARSFAVVNAVEMRGNEKYLVLQEVSTNDTRQVLQNRELLDGCDVLCFVYDTSDPNSFAYVLNLRKQYPLDKYPTVFIGTKGDLPRVTQIAAIQPEEYCTTLKLAPPLHLSVKNNDAIDLYSIIVGVALNPHVAIPEELSRPQRAIVRAILLSAVGASALAVAGVYAWRFYRRPAGAVIVPETPSAPIGDGAKS